jgi:anti-sigma B factor antagonist
VTDPDYLVERLQRGGVEVLRLAGDLDINARTDVTDAIAAAVTTGRPIEVDLAGVTFLDSEGLAGLIEGFQVAQAAGRSFRVAGARGLVLRVLTVSGALDVFNRS